MDERRDFLAVVIDVDHHRRIDLIPIPGIVGIVLMVRHDFARLGFHGEYRVAVERAEFRVLRRGTLVGQPRTRIADAPIHQVEFGIVGAGHPNGTAAVLVRIAFPGVAVLFARAWNRVNAPRFFTGLRIERGEESANAHLAARTADHDLVFDDQRRERAVIALRVIGNLRIPNDFAGLRVERNQMRIDGRRINEITE